MSGKQVGPSLFGWIRIGTNRNVYLTVPRSSVEPCACHRDPPRLSRSTRPTRPAPSGTPPECLEFQKEQKELSCSFQAVLVTIHHEMMSTHVLWKGLFMILLPVDGTWTTWTSWNYCSVSCGTGSRVRSRQCPLASHGGLAECNTPGQYQYQFKTCYQPQCPRKQSSCAKRTP